MWISDDQEFDYRFLRSGSLEFRDRRGRYRQIWGCTADGWHEFWERLENCFELLKTAPDEYCLDRLYLEHDQFRHECDRCIELNGIDFDWITPKMVSWLLFPLVAEIQSPLVRLNTPYEPKHPPLLGGETISGRVEFLAALASVCDGNLAEAVTLAKSQSARDLLHAMSEKAWALASQEDKDKAILSDAKKRMRRSWNAS